MILNWRLSCGYEVARPGAAEPGLRSAATQPQWDAVHCGIDLQSRGVMHGNTVNSAKWGLLSSFP
jgi:hypothetical protein